MSICRHTHTHKHTHTHTQYIYVHTVGVCVCVCVCVCVYLGIGAGRYVAHSLAFAHNPRRRRARAREEVSVWGRVARVSECMRTNSPTNCAWEEVSVCVWERSFIDWREGDCWFVGRIFTQPRYVSFGWVHMDPQDKTTNILYHFLTRFICKN